MTILFSLLLLTAGFEPAGGLVLRSGEIYPVVGTMTVSDDRIIFRHANGSLYSLPADEIDLDATRARAEAVSTAQPNPPAVAAQTPPERRLRIPRERKEELLRQLEQNHAPGSSPVAGFTPPQPDPQQEARARHAEQQEWYWRNLSLHHQEALRQRKEELDLLLAQQQRLEDEILGLSSLGYRADQFSYQILQLQRTRDAIPAAKLNVERARRALDQFQDEARRRGILPGWLR